MIDYNELMKNLDSCLGLEKSAEESIKTSPQKPQKSVFEGYDDVETELALEMGLNHPTVEKEEELVFEEPVEDDGDIDTDELEPGEGEDEDEVDHKEIFKSLAKDLFTELCQEVGEEEAKVTMGNLLDEVISQESKEKIIGDDDEVSEDRLDKQDDEDRSATEGSLTDRLIALGKNEATEIQSSVTEETSEEPVYENQESVGDSSDEENGDAAFEALSAKMLSRYSSLVKSSGKVNSATEGQSSQKVEIDDEALRRVSCEFGYSGHHLRKMVTEAINKGVI